MPYDSNGNYTLPAIYKAKPATTIMTEQHNNPLEDIQSALNSVLLRNGSVSMTGNWNMGQNKVTNLADATADSDAANYGQVKETLNNVPSVTDWTSKQAIPASDANKAFVRNNAGLYGGVIALDLYGSDAGRMAYRTTDGSWHPVQPYGDYATNTALTSETNRATTSENNLQSSKVNRAGDIMTGPLTVTGPSSGVNVRSDANAGSGYNDASIYFALNKRFGYAASIGLREAVGSSLNIMLSVFNGSSWYEFDLVANGTNQGRLVSPAGVSALISDLSNYVPLSNYQNDFQTSDVRVTNLPYNQREVSFNVQITSQGQYVPFPEAFSGNPVSVIVSDCGNGRTTDAWPVSAPQAQWSAAGCNVFIGSGHVPRQVSIRAKGSR